MCENGTHLRRSDAFSKKADRHAREKASLNSEKEPVVSRIDADGDPEEHGSLDSRAERKADPVLTSVQHAVLGRASTRAEPRIQIHEL